MLRAWTTFFEGSFLRPKAHNEVMRYIVQGLTCLTFCRVPVPTDYLPNIVSSADTSNKFVDCVFRRNIAEFSLFGFDRLQLFLCGSQARLVMFLILLASTTIKDIVPKLWELHFCDILGQNDVDNTVFFDD